MFGIRSFSASGALPESEWTLSMLVAGSDQSVASFGTDEGMSDFLTLPYRFLIEQR